MRRAASPQQRQQVHAKQHRLLAVESMVKIAVSLVVSTVSLATLVHVIPTRVSQQEKLQELRSEVTMTEQRVAKLKTEFSRSFDPSNVREIAQEQTHFADPNRTPIVWLDRKGEVSATLPD
jgi:cell division protein FtsB